MSQRSTDRTILVAEDNEEDFFTLTRLCKNLALPYLLFRCTKGEDALDFLYQRNAFAAPGTSMRPSLILLDINLFSLDGHVVLSRIKNDPQLKSIPVVIITTLSSDREIAFCYQEGASGYITKSVNLEHYQVALQNLLHYWLETVQLPN